ncbi:MAG: glycosyltransferase [Candidatus Heimdallarchaeota archaeon]|nr:glycosyltransferase [Candidatus Heimdallarchaeota archaeon]MDH5647802.1 glycosyltransferase [Candidatus Heimdallarchaeota archaeon]
MNNLLEFIIFITFTPVLIIFIYIALILFLGRQNTNIGITLNTHYPEITVIIPTFNEAKTIRKRIENLVETDYNVEKLHILVIDESTDETKEIISELNLKNVVIIHSKHRLGYTDAVKKGISMVTTPLIMLIDAGSRHDKLTLPNLVRWFSDPLIGAVTGQNMIYKSDNSTAKDEINYRKFYNIARMGEQKLYSTFHMHGEATLVRTSIAKKVILARSNLDIAMGLESIIQGYRNIFDPEVKFYEVTPSNFSNRYKQKRIRARGVIRLLLDYRKKLLFKSKYGLFGLIIFPAHYMSMIILPISSIFFSITIIYILIINRYLLFIITLIIIVSILILFKKGIISNIILIYGSLISGLISALQWNEHSDFIDKVDQTRDDLSEIEQNYDDTMKK